MDGMKKHGILYIVPTPIGNLEDITYRAIATLKQVSLIGAEDTRHSAYLLQEYQISTPTISYHKFNEKSRVEKFIDLLQEGKDIAIISDAGTPGISDPASCIIKEAIKQDIAVVTLPGATAFLPALVSSGFDISRFLFCGFLPAKKSEKEKFLHDISHLTYPLVFYEAPHRLTEFLRILHEHLGNRKTVIAREISKKFETIYRGRLSDFLENTSLIKLKGEITVICEGADKNRIVPDSEILENLDKYLSRGETRSFAINKVSDDLKVPKNRVYTIAHQK
jgi:16S rRNA (cytidine1402-2'-O)-methyltransferase